MLYTVYVLLFLLIINAQDLPCKEMGKFSECSREAGLQVAGCSSDVKSSPDAKYYSCLCEGYKANLLCFWHCPDDKMMLLQLRTHEENMQTSCKQAEDLKQKEYLSNAVPSSTKKTSASGTATDSIASATKTSRAPSSKTSSEAPAATGGSAAQAPSPTAAISLLPFVSDGSRSDFDDWMGLLLLWTFGAWFF